MWASESALPLHTPGHQIDAVCQARGLDSKACPFLVGHPVPLNVASLPGPELRVPHLNVIAESADNDAAVEAGVVA